MEAVGVVLPPISVDRAGPLSFSCKSLYKLGSRSGSGVVGHRNLGVSWKPVRRIGFRDEGHLEYYSCSGKIRCGEKKEKVKKRLKFVKGLYKDLALFSEMGSGLGLGADGQGLVDQVKGQMILEAAEFLLGQLEQMRAEEKKLKKRKKEEKAKSKVAQMRQHGLDCGMSLRSSSESSDSECDEVVDMSGLKHKSVTQPVTSALEPLTSVNRSISTEIIHETTSDILSTSAQGVEVQSSSTLDENCCSRDLNSLVDVNLSSISITLGSESSLVEGTEMKKIEVCMGGKCKKSGALALLEQFQKAVGREGAMVSGCKCMGKCRDGPNVRVVNDSLDRSQHDSVRTSNPLCIGVCLEDVETIVANFFGRNPNELGLAATAS